MEDGLDGAHLAGAGVVTDLEERLLRTFDQLPGLAPVRQHLGLDLPGRVQDPAH